MTSNKQRSSGALDVAVMGGAAAALAAAAGLIGLVRGGNRSQVRAVHRAQGNCMLRASV